MAKRHVVRGWQCYCLSAAVWPQFWMQCFCLQPPNYRIVS